MISLRVVGSICWIYRESTQGVELKAPGVGFEPTRLKESSAQHTLHRGLTADNIDLQPVWTMVVSKAVARHHEGSSKIG